VLGEKAQGIAEHPAALSALLQRAKVTACPHCGAIGTLNAHGFLRGYVERTDARIERGRRFYCSNRHRRPGCGRSFSILLASFLSGFIVLAHTLWTFAVRVCAGVPKQHAWHDATSGAFSRSSGYRMWRRLSLAQPFLRGLLHQACGPPACENEEPLAQMIAHCAVAFPVSACPFERVQSHFQCHLLRRV
jgi:hypothetical protein